MRTPLTYYGGKQRLAPQIAPLLPERRVYLEAFAGGAAVLFHRPMAQRETLNDADGQIVAFWRAVRDRPQELAEALASTPYSREEWAACNARAEEAQRTGDDAADDVEAARRLLVSCDQSFSRSRESWSNPCLGEGRGRWQPGTWVNLPPKVLAAAQRLRGVALEHRDGLELIPRWDNPDATIYVDPPYAGQHRLRPGRGYAHDADSKLWGELAEVLAAVRHAAVVVSGYPCEEMDALGWRRVSLHARRTVQAAAGGELPMAPEVAWLSPEVPEQVPALFDSLEVC